METQTKTFYGTQILEELNQEQAEKLRPQPGISVAVIIYASFIKDEVGKIYPYPKMLHIKEVQSYSVDLIPKVPSGGVDTEDINIYAAAARELFGETGHTAEKWHFVRAVETTTTRTGERHFKVFLAGQNPKKVGEPTESCIKEVSVTPINEMRVGKHLTYDQLIGFRAYVDTMQCTDKDNALAFMNFRAPEWEPRTR